jgi:transposase
MIDESPTKEAGAKAWLWTFVAGLFTVFAVRGTRAATVLGELLTDAFAGVVVCDRGRSRPRLNWPGRGAACFSRRVAELLRAGLDLRDRHAAGEIGRHGQAVARGRLENRLSGLIVPPKANAANERLAQHLWVHRGDLFTVLRQPGLDATNWRAELAIRFGVILRKVWGGSPTWAGAWAQAVLMSVWRTCWQQGRCALDFPSQLLRGTPVALALPP